jgi:DNA-binding transcriptional LysR family regulator
MDSNLLKIFITVASKKSVSLGAVELGLAQSNVTSRIKYLERELGHLLFHRTPKGVLLTNEGEKLYPNAVEIVNKVEETIFKMKNIKEQKMLRIGSNQSSASMFLIPFITKINEDFPDTKIELYTDTTPFILEALNNYKIDVGFISGTPRGKNILILKKFEEEVFIIKSKENKTENCLIGYQDSCAYYTFFVSYLKEQNNDLYKSIFFKNYETILGCVKAGMGKSIMPLTLIKKFGYENDLIMTEIDRRNFDLSEYLICRKENPPVIEKYIRESSFI